MFLPLNSFENICVCFLLMIIYSTAGWVGEMIYHSIVIKHLSEKRGFLNGFLCPIYGHGAQLFGLIDVADDGTGDDISAEAASADGYAKRAMHAVGGRFADE